ncbi:hypothetical protein HK100_000173 [Physocladia obscura]|uniref:Enkurin domain-containing protein n=1 Tax=Physocladia obscura TaxID=109957 RepID=A0AAD5XH50_9FUNG|nr:hypothetical protein HK100_000173 [Physocladia obscura]
MAATVQHMLQSTILSRQKANQSAVAIVTTSSDSRRVGGGSFVGGIPTDPLDESIYNMVLRPGVDDRPPQLYKSRFAKSVRSETMKRCGVIKNEDKKVKTGSGIGEKIVISSSRLKAENDGASGNYKVPTGLQKPYKTHVNRIEKNSGLAKKRKDVSKFTPSAKTISKPISNPTSGRIAMAAERRSNASTPVVADPCAWDHIAADAAENATHYIKSPLRGGKDRINDDGSAGLVTGEPGTKIKKGCDEAVPEELLEHWDPFSQEDAKNNANDNETATTVFRSCSPPPTEMASGTVRKHHHLKKGTGGGGNSKNSFNAVINNDGAAAVGATASAGSIGGGSRRRMLPEAERFAVLAGLKSNYQSLMGIYNRLPVTTDTVSKINRKTSIEKQLNLLEQDIKKFSHPNIIIEEGQ